MQRNITTSLLVGFDFSNNDKAIVVVGKKRKNQSVEIINAFEGEEAIDIYKKLVGDKKGLDE